MLRALLLAVALLFAQQASLAHAITHQGPVCELHAAMSTSCGAVDAARQPLKEVVELFRGFPPVQADGACLPAPAPSSRGPPQVSLSLKTPVL